MSNLILPLPSMLGTFLDSREPYDEVRVDEAISGKEARSSWWFTPRYKYKLQFDCLRSDAGSRLDFQQWASFFSRHFGQLDSFLFSDPTDNAVAAHGFGVGDGATTAFQLQRTPGGSVFDVLGGPWATSSTPRTNLVTQSQTFDNAAWTKASASITAAAAIAPDGNLTGEKLVEAAATAVHSASSANVAVTSGAAYVASVFAKASTRSQIVIKETLASAAAAFDLSAGVVLGTSGGTASIVACGNGWYRCSLLYAAGSTSNTTLQVALSTGGLGGTSYLGDGASGAFIWGAQFEVGAAVTQYIVTTSAAVTVSPTYWPGIGGGFEPVTEVAPGAQIFVNGVAKVQGTDYTIAFNGGSSPCANGVITFGAAPASGAVLTWTGSYYRRVRLLNQSWPAKNIVPNFWSTSLELVSVK